MTERVGLYRHFNSKGDLLYVGVSRDPWIRWINHRRDKTWAEQVVEITIDWYPGRAAARRAEAQAILREMPIYNRTRYRPHPGRLEVAEVEAELNSTEARLERLRSTLRRSDGPVAPRSLARRAKLSRWWVLNRGLPALRATGEVVEVDRWGRLALSPASEALDAS